MASVEGILMTYVIGFLASEVHPHRLRHWTQVAAAVATFGFLVLLVLGAF